MATLRRAYLETHPWIEFRVRPHLRRRAVLDVARRGALEGRSSRPGAPQARRSREEMHQVYLAKGAQATTAIEGNTPQRGRGCRAIVAGTAATPPPSQQYQHREVENILGAFNRIKDRPPRGRRRRDHAGRDRARIRPSQVLDGSRGRTTSAPARSRHARSVVVGCVSRCTARRTATTSLARMCEWLNGPDFDPPND